MEIKGSQQTFSEAEETGNELHSINPEVLILGDYTLDLFIYDRPRITKPEQLSGWTPPLSREAWQYAQGYEAKYCVGGAASIQAMLAANGIQVNGNSFANELYFAGSQSAGSIFVLHRRPNKDKDGRTEDRKYLTIRLDERDIKYDASVVSRRYTWRVDQSFLNAPDIRYVKDFDLSSVNFETTKIVCLYDFQRGFASAFKPESETGDARSKALAAAAKGKALVIRAPDPRNFESILRAVNTADSLVTLICPLAEMSDDNLRSSGTWSGIWRHTYSYLRRQEFLLNNNDWAVNVIVPVYQDGALWFGPRQWALAEDERGSFTAAGAPSTGRLFVLPGSQPRLYEFEEPDLTIGTNTLIAYTMIEGLLPVIETRLTGNNHESSATEGSTAISADEVISNAIMRGLTRIRRFHNRGYCELDELSRIPALKPGNRHIHYPKEIWRNGFVELTDLLLRKDVEGNQLAGAYEVRCRIGDLQPKGRTDDFDCMEKALDSGGEYIGSRGQCRYIATYFESAASRKARYALHDDKDKVDDFVGREIASFELWRRISMQFGTFSIANPFDSEPILDLAQKIRQHVAQNRFLSPDKGKVFSFALFGTPGSGKSTLAKQLARSVDPSGSIFTERTFNLSQFAVKDQLLRAFGEIAAEGLGGKIPLVLWDEFDTVFEGKRGGWLAQFLMPMQDARYFDGREVKPLGTALFAFIGGTFADAETFRAWACGRHGQPAVSKADGGGAREDGDGARESVLLKGRDFHSRLFTALDMPAITYHREDTNDLRQVLPDRNEPYNYQRLARSVLLRWLLLDASKIHGQPRLREVDQDILDILLDIPLRHGARSLQRIVEACLVSGPSRLSMHHLPPQGFLAEHIETTTVDGDGQQTNWSVEKLLLRILSEGEG